MTREQKIKKDSKALQKYAQHLKNEHKVYLRIFDAYAVNQRRSRAAAAHRGSASPLMRSE